MSVLQKIQSFFQKKSAGFTLIEIMVSVALFTIVVTISMGALLTVVDTNRKAQTLQLVMNNLNFAIESMVREMREATVFTPTANNESIYIMKTNGTGVTFSVTDHVLFRKEDGGTDEQLTADGISIDQTLFQTQGVSSGKPERLLMIVKGHSVTTKEVTGSTFSIQTTVAQRNKPVATP